MARVLLVGLLSTALLVPAAVAFNPQPEPPATPGALARLTDAALNPQPDPPLAIDARGYVDRIQTTDAGYLHAVGPASGTTVGFTAALPSPTATGAGLIDRAGAAPPIVPTVKSLV